MYSISFVIEYAALELLHISLSEIRGQLEEKRRKQCSIKAVLTFRRLSPKCNKPILMFQALLVREVENV